MNSKLAWSALIALAMFFCRADGTEPGMADLLPPMPIGEEVVGQDAAQPPVKTPEKKPDEKKQPLPPVKAIEPEKIKLPEPEKMDVLSLGPQLGQMITTGFNPHMMGDFSTVFALQKITVSGFTTTTMKDTSFETRPITTTITVTKTPFTQTRTVLVAVPSEGAFSLAENGSPVPQDRVFFTYNYYGDLRGPNSGPNAVVNNTVVTVPTNNLSEKLTVTTTTFTPGAPSVALNREVVGFEKTFLDGYASFELRVPILQQTRGDTFGGDFAGDLTLIGKYAFYWDKTTNDLMSVGMALTVPTGPGIPTIAGNVHDTLFQPYFGYVKNFDNFFIQGIHSIVVPTSSHDVTMMLNDLGIYYRLFNGRQDELLSSIVPCFEAHVITPLDHRDIFAPIYQPDMCVLTMGSHFGIFANTTLTFAVATPVTGPNLFSIEAFGQLNWRF